MNAAIKVLFVDGDEAEFLLIKRLLGEIESRHYELTRCEELAKALPLILSHQFDVVLLDYHWPEQTARDVLNIARVQLCKTPIVIMTSDAESNVDVTAIANGAADYLVKGQIDSKLFERTLRFAIERKQTELHLAQLAHYDPLTQIPNRMLFRDRLEHVLSMAERNNTDFALMFIDLNGFKEVNDNFGHDVGDEIIRICAKRLTQCLRKSDSVARMGGDEFTLLLPNTSQQKDLIHLAEKVIEALSQPAEINGHLVVVGCSIGIAIYPVAGRDVDRLMKHADMAMYRAKQDSGSSFRFFTETMNQDVRRQLRLESDLRIALNRQEFEVKYLPRYEISTNRIVAVEAQLYWNKPGVGLLPAHIFMSTAEEIGIVHSLGYWTLRQACYDLKKLQPVLGDHLMMAINFSVRQFQDENLVREVARIFSDYDIQPGDIEFELSETVLAFNIDMVALSMRPLAFFGINFLLNNFGAGNSSFLHLVRLPISSVKIDRAVFTELSRSLHEKKLIAAMITLTHNLGKWVVIDGVETQEQEEWLKSLGCDLMQGDYFSKPLSLDELLQKPTGLHSALSS